MSAFSLFQNLFLFFISPFFFYFFQFDFRAYLIFTPLQSQVNYVTAHVFVLELAAMIGKMADDKESGEKAGNNNSEEEDDEEEEMTNGKSDVEDDDESEFDDPEGFVDDITDEGKNLQYVLWTRQSRQLLKKSVD